MSNSSYACRLSHRGVLRAGGDDRSAFLQNLISNDMALCQQDRPLYAALLTPQGKFLYDLFLYDVGDAFLIDCERADDLLRQLTTYKLRAKVTLSSMNETHEVLAFPSGTAGYQDPRLPALGSRGVFLKGQIPAGYEVADASVYDPHRLALGITDVRDMIVGKSTLSDGNFDLLNGISWTKGCYVGQELTARMHHRALVKKRMFLVRVTGAAPEAGTPIFFKGADIGEMRSSQGEVGLALLNIDHTKQAIAENENMICADAKLMPYVPDWMIQAI